ncbi:MAG: class B sortase [Oscillospiraceae bacterium]
MKQEDKTKRYIALAIGAAICLALAVIIGMGIKSSKGDMPQVGGTTKEEVAQLPQAPAEIKISADSPLGKAKAKNEDAVGWLKIPGTEIDNVVMQAPDNEYYLSRDEAKEKSPWGCYFADYYADLTSTKNLIQNTVIYGHTENIDNPDGKRFSQLFKFTDLDFTKANRNIYLTVGASDATFEVFAVFYSDTDFYYIDPSPSDQGFDKFMAEVNARNEFIFEGVEVTEQDKLLTLSGCSHKYDEDKTGDQRIVVMAKQVKDGTTPTGAITKKPTPKHP